MDLDLETFLVALYVIVDDLYQSDITPCMPACGGPPAQRSDSEVLCLGWRPSGAAACRGIASAVIMRYVRKHLRHLFPECAYPECVQRRLRALWGAFILIEDAVAAQLAQGDYDVMDGFPIPVAQGVGRSTRGGWPISPGLAKGAMTAISTACA